MHFYYHDIITLPSEDERVVVCPGKEYLKMLSDNDIVLSPFSLALVFSLARISFLEDGAFKLLRVTVGGNFALGEMRASSDWISRQSDLLIDVNKSTSMDVTIKKIVANSACGWE